ncbi:MAG: L,D-transpeptidase [Mogibacterium sp.]|nr:L,D-transpeptidase [Mogibacterium sp.]
MKKKVISILLSVIMVLSACTFAFAEDTVAAPQKPGAITWFNTYSACHSVVLEWKKTNPAATEYRIYRDGKCIKKGDASKFTKSAYDKKHRLVYRDKGAKDEKWHTYYIVAVNEAGSTKSEVKKDQSVIQMYIKFTFGRTRSLTSHDGKNITRTFPKGTTMKATGYSMGTYRFYDNRKHYYHVNYMSVRDQKALYTKKFNYSKREAEYFANTSGIASNTKHLVWASLYTQHIYVLQGKKGKWRINSKTKYDGKAYKDWEISSGTPYTPSPWGINLRYRGKLSTIYRKQRYNPEGGASLWNFYHSQTALHGPAGSQGYGDPHSHGCIRNPQDCAEFLFNKIPRGTRVVIY